MPEDPLSAPSPPAHARHNASTSAAASRLTAERSNHAARVREVLSAGATTTPNLNNGHANAAAIAPAPAADVTLPNLHEASVSHSGTAPHSPAASRAVPTPQTSAETPRRRDAQAAAGVQGSGSHVHQARSPEHDAFQVPEDTGRYLPIWQDTEPCFHLFSFYNLRTVHLPHSWKMCRHVPSS